MTSRLVILDTSVYPFRDELLVELTARDRDGDLVALSFQFEHTGPNGEVSPMQPVDDNLEDDVAEALVANGYRWEGQ